MEASETFRFTRVKANLKLINQPPKIKFSCSHIQISTEKSTPLKQVYSQLPYCKVQSKKKSNHFLLSNPLKNCHNFKVQRMSNLYCPKDEKPSCYFFSRTTYKLSLLKIPNNGWPILLILSPMSNRFGTFVIVSNQTNQTNQTMLIQRMSNQYIYYSLWATTYFFLLGSLANEMC